jgi:hypothetical protein
MADPRLLPCKQGHSFCDKCVHRLAISSLSLTTAACPLCRQEVPISDSGIIFTTRDITRAKLLDTNKRCEGKDYVRVVYRNNDNIIIHYYFKSLDMRYKKLIK